MDAPGRLITTSEIRQGQILWLRPGKEVAPGYLKMKSLNITAGALDHPVVVMDVGEVGNPDVIRVCGLTTFHDTNVEKKWPRDHHLCHEYLPIWPKGTCCSSWPTLQLKENVALKRLGYVNMKNDYKVHSVMLKRYVEKVEDISHWMLERDSLERLLALKEIPVDEEPAFHGHIAFLADKSTPPTSVGDEEVPRETDIVAGTFLKMKAKEDVTPLVSREYEDAYLISIMTIVVDGCRNDHMTVCLVHDVDHMRKYYANFPGDGQEFLAVAPVKPFEKDEVPLELHNKETLTRPPCIDTASCYKIHRAALLRHQPRPLKTLDSWSLLRLAQAMGIQKQKKDPALRASWRTKFAAGNRMKRGSICRLRPTEYIEPMDLKESRVPLHLGGRPLYVISMWGRYKKICAIVYDDEFPPNVHGLTATRATESWLPFKHLSTSTRTAQAIQLRENRQLQRPGRLFLGQTWVIRSRALDFYDIKDESTEFRATAESHKFVVDRLCWLEKQNQIVPPKSIIPPAVRVPAISPAVATDSVSPTSYRKKIVQTLNRLLFDEITKSQHEVRFQHVLKALESIEVLVDSIMDVIGYDGKKLPSPGVQGDDGLYSPPSSSVSDISEGDQHALTTGAIHSICAWSVILITMTLLVGPALVALGMLLFTLALFFVVPTTRVNFALLIACAIFLTLHLLLVSFKDVVGPPK